MDVNVENSAVREEVRAEKKKQDIKGIIWTVVGVMIFTVLMALAFRYIEDALNISRAAHYRDFSYELAADRSILN